MAHDVFGDTWNATDALGRELPGWAECGSPREGKFVGIFYFLCNIDDSPQPPLDVTRTIAQNPDHPPFIPNKSYYWGEPELGYYRSTDRWAIRRHAYMLADAGIDTLIFDVTNDVIFPQTVAAVCEVFRQVRAEGERTPDVCFLGSEKSIYQLWEQIYSQGLYQDLWFHWQGKPLLLFGHHAELHGDMNAITFPKEITDFFTMRKSWAWDSLAWYGDQGYHRWPWVAHYPQCVGWDQPGVPEQVPVAVGQHPLSGIGRSFHDGKQPAVDRFDVTPDTGKGLHFAEQWRRALEVDPQFIFITGWNEWMAGSVACQDPSEEALQKLWSFFPGATLGRATHPLHKGDIYFIDQYNQEFSRDAEPMRGGHTDNYYYQMVANIRRYKGVRPQPAASASQTIRLDGGIDQWEAVLPDYRDHLFETGHRREPGFGGAGLLTHELGRNEFIQMKVAHDDGMLYFLARCRAPITSYTGPGWMLLFLKISNPGAPDWLGYHYLINGHPLDESHTTVEKSAGGWNWERVGTVEFRRDADRMVIAVPRRLLGLERDPLAFDFHYCDNLQPPFDEASFLTCGDSAPNRRFNYHYQA